MQSIKAGDAQQGQQYTSRGGDSFTAGPIVTEGGAQYRRVVALSGVHTDLPLDYDVWPVVEEPDVEHLVGMDEAELRPQLAALGVAELEALSFLDQRSWLMTAIAELLEDEPGTEPESPVLPALSTAICPVCSAEQVVQAGAFVAHMQPAGGVCPGSRRADPVSAGLAAPAPTVEEPAPEPPARDPLLEPCEGDSVRTTTGRVLTVMGVSDKHGILISDGSVESHHPIGTWRVATEGGTVVDVQQEELWTAPETDPWAGVGPTAPERVKHLKTATTAAETDRWVEALVAAGGVTVQSAVIREQGRHKIALERCSKLLDQRGEAKKLRVMLTQDRTTNRPGLVAAINRRLARLDPDQVPVTPAASTPVDVPVTPPATAPETRADRIREGGSGFGSGDCPYGLGAKRDAWQEGRQALVEGIAAHQGGLPLAANPYDGAAHAAPNDFSLSALADVWVAGWTKVEVTARQAEGAAAYAAGDLVESVPYVDDSDDRAAWVMGWLLALRADPEASAGPGFDEADTVEMALQVIAGRLAYAAGVPVLDVSDPHRLQGWWDAKVAAGEIETPAEVSPVTSDADQARAILDEYEADGDARPKPFMDGRADQDEDQYEGVELEVWRLGRAVLESLIADGVVTRGPASHVGGPGWDLSTLPWPKRIAASSVACALELIAECTEPFDLQEAWVEVDAADECTELQEALETRWEAITGGSWVTDPGPAPPAARTITLTGTDSNGERRTRTFANPRYAPGPEYVHVDRPDADAIAIADNKIEPPHFARDLEHIHAEVLKDPGARTFSHLSLQEKGSPGCVLRVPGPGQGAEWNEKAGADARKAGVSRDRAPVELSDEDRIAWLVGWDREEVTRTEEHAEAAISVLEREGHTEHCAKRMVWGDGECTCPGDGTGSPHHTMNPSPPFPSREGQLSRYLAEWPRMASFAKSKGLRITLTLDSESS